MEHSVQDKTSTVFLLYVLSPSFLFTGGVGMKD